MSENYKFVNKPKGESPLDQLDRYMLEYPKGVSETIERIEDFFGTKMNDQTPEDLSNQYLESWQREWLMNRIPAAVLAVAASPVMLGLAVAIKLEGEFDILFKQERIGVDGQTFDLYKMGSLVPLEDGQTEDPDILLHNNENPENHPRATRLGRFIRKYELDELPQLYQIAFGRNKMRLIGYRAIPQYLLDDLVESDEWSEERLTEFLDGYNAVGPSLLGLPQGLSKHPKNTGERFHLDMLYKRNASMGTDIYLMFRAFRRIIRR